MSRQNHKVENSFIMAIYGKRHKSNDFVKIKDVSSYVNLVDAESTEFRQGMEFRGTDMRCFDY